MRCFIDHVLFAITALDQHMFNTWSSFFTRCITLLTRRTLSGFFLVRNIYLSWKLQYYNMAHAA